MKKLILQCLLFCAVTVLAACSSSSPYTYIVPTYQGILPATIETVESPSSPQSGYILAVNGVDTSSLWQIEYPQRAELPPGKHMLHLKLQQLFFQNWVPIGIVDLPCTLQSGKSYRVAWTYFGQDEGGVAQIFAQCVEKR